MCRSWQTRGRNDQMYCSRMFAFCAKDHMVLMFCSLKEPPLLTGVLEPNTKLRKAERLWENQLVGPESIVNIGGKH